MHEIQTHVIHQLILKKDGRYRDIKPPDIEGNLFMYHLHQLIKDGLVSKTPTGHYCLTAAGLRLADNFSLEQRKPRIQPKIVTLLAVKNNQGEYLLYERARQPFHGLVGFPYGKIHLGEKIAEAAARELAEKTGLRADLLHSGDAYLTIWENGELVSQMLCHVFLGKNPEGELKTDSSIGRCFWSNGESEKSGDFFPGFPEIYQLVQKGGDHFFEEITIKKA